MSVLIAADLPGAGDLESYKWNLDIFLKKLSCKYYIIYNSTIEILLKLSSSQIDQAGADSSGSPGKCQLI